MHIATAEPIYNSCTRDYFDLWVQVQSTYEAVEYSFESIDKKST